MRWIYLVATAFGLIGTGAVGAQTEGYRLTNDRIIVDTRQSWQNWQFPQGTLELAADGQVRPRRLRRNINAGLDIVDFLRRYPPRSAKGKSPEEITLLDAIQAGSNREQVVRVLDGDHSTYWEPTPIDQEADLASLWWFVVDLGRLTFIEKIVLKFVDQGQGDPFLLFDVLVSNGLASSRLSGNQTPQFKSVLRTLKPNKNQRLFAIDFRDIVEVGGEGARLVKVVITGSDLERGQEIDPKAYERLAEADRGAIDYFKRQPDGREAVVKQTLYEQLEPERQGPVRYYRRERPRLAELEVWTEGDEIAGDAIARGGFISSNRNLNVASFLDSDLSTFSFLQFDDLDMEIVSDLGAHFWIDTHRQFYHIGGSAASSSFPSYKLDFSDGSRAPDGSLRWRNAVEREQIPIFDAQVEGNEFALLKARFFRFQWTATGGAAVLAELQFYGRGYQPEVYLQSDLVRLGGRRNLLSIDWEADSPPGTQVLIQTRTGNELGQILHYFDKGGNEVTEAEYRDMLSFSRGDSIPEAVPGSDWSDWSEPYADPTGSPILSPSPREFLKIRATLLSDNPDTSAALRAIHIDFAKPLVQSIVGEVFPAQVDSLGVERRFSLYIRPQFAAGDIGFDELLLRASADMQLQFSGLYGGQANDFAAGSQLEGVVRLPSRQDSLQLKFSGIGPSDGIELLRLDFTTALFSTGTILRAALRHSTSGGEGWQRVDPGDALASVASNTTTLLGTAQSKALLIDIEVHPPVFTPNGDGINDSADLVFKVVRLSDDSPVELSIYDLSGRRIRHLVERRSLSTGQYSMSWDGRDDTGAKVAPGIYCGRLRINAELAGAGVTDREVLRTVAVTY